MTAHKVGISGLAAYLPPYRVDLEDWCAWSGNDWDKTRHVVGTGFRMMGPYQSVYTMAATAALRLIDQYGIDPQRVRFLGLGTESSTDNSAGAVIVRGMLDDALRQRGAPALSRNCEVPEFKHACLGGVYALKSALRFLALEPGDAVAIVVSADIAKYAAGSSGESTQGAGAVAVLLEKNPQLLEVNLAACGSSSDYRAVDFRKPLLTHADGSTLFKDTPVFNGKYSTSCYLDATLHALRDMEARMGSASADYYAGVQAIFMHRPYQRMPLVAWAFNHLMRLARQGKAGQSILAEYCAAANIPLAGLLNEMRTTPHLLELTLNGDMDRDPYPLTMELLKSIGKAQGLGELIENRMVLGAELMRELGNIYSASLFAWLAAGLEEAANNGTDWTAANILAIGYGSGDAAEALPMSLADNWRSAAAKIAFSEALASAQNLSEQQYRLLHSTGNADGLQAIWQQEFLIDRIGSNVTPPCEDNGIEYYRYVSAENIPAVITAAGGTRR